MHLTPEARVLFNQLHAEYSDINGDQFTHPISGAVVGRELHSWTPEYFINWYTEESFSWYTGADQAKRIAHLVSMAKAVIA